MALEALRRLRKIVLGRRLLDSRLLPISFASIFLSSNLLPHVRLQKPVQEPAMGANVDIGGFVQPAQVQELHESCVELGRTLDELPASAVLTLQRLLLDPDRLAFGHGYPSALTRPLVPKLSHLLPTHLFEYLARAIRTSVSSRDL